jgi:hypothetical protein
MPCKIKICTEFWHQDHWFEDMNIIWLRRLAWECTTAFEVVVVTTSTATTMVMCDAHSIEHCGWAFLFILFLMIFPCFLPILLNHGWCYMQRWWTFMMIWFFWGSVLMSKFWSNLNLEIGRYLFEKFFKCIRYKPTNWKKKIIWFWRSNGACKIKEIIICSKIDARV